LPARNVQLKQLATHFTQVGVDTTQSKWISDSINEHSSMPYLAAVILLLPSAAQDAVAAACNSTTSPADLLALAKQTADTNNQQALLIFNQTAPSTPTPCLSPDYSQGPAASAHGAVVPMTPGVELQKFDNGGICTSTLSYPEEEAEEVVDRSRQASKPTTMMLARRLLTIWFPQPGSRKHGRWP
jgi:hypothetical protein